MPKEHTRKLETTISHMLGMEMDAHFLSEILQEPGKRGEIRRQKPETSSVARLHYHLVSGETELMEPQKVLPVQLL